MSEAVFLFCLFKKPGSQIAQAIMPHPSASALTRASAVRMHWHTDVLCFLSATASLNQKNWPASASWDYSSSLPRQATLVFKITKEPVNCTRRAVWVNVPFGKSFKGSRVRHYHPVLAFPCGETKSSTGGLLILQNSCCQQAIPAVHYWLLALLPSHWRTWSLSTATSYTAEQLKLHQIYLSKWEWGSGNVISSQSKSLHCKFNFF